MVACYMQSPSEIIRLVLASLLKKEIPYITPECFRIGNCFHHRLRSISLQFFNEANQDLDNLMTLLKAKDRFERKIDISS